MSDLHIHTWKLVPEAAKGGAIPIERRGKPVAELCRFRASRASHGKEVQIIASMRRTWALMKSLRILPAR